VPARELHAEPFPSRGVQAFASTSETRRAGPASKRNSLKRASTVVEVSDRSAAPSPNRLARLKFVVERPQNSRQLLSATEADQSPKSRASPSPNRGAHAYDCVAGGSF
jgi:hypothetical protein